MIEVTMMRGGARQRSGGETHSLFACKQSPGLS